MDFSRRTNDSVSDLVIFTKAKNLTQSIQESEHREHRGKPAGKGAENRVRRGRILCGGLRPLLGLVGERWGRIWSGP